MDYILLRFGQWENIKKYLNKNPILTRDIFIWASRNMRIDILKYITSMGIGDIYLYNRALDYASLCGDFDTVKYLVEGLGANSIDQSIFAALEYSHHDGIVKYFIEKGANQNTTMMYAIKNNNMNIVKFITEDRNTNISLSMYWASRYNNLEMVKYFLEKGANIDEAIISASDSGHINLIEYFINQNMDMGYALQHASEHGHLEIVKMIICKCTYINNVRKRNAILWASWNGHVEIVKYFADHGTCTSGISNVCKEYIALCEKIKWRMSKKIYFWWVQLCYNINYPHGQRMMQKNYNEHVKLYNNKIE